MEFFLDSTLIELVLDRLLEQELSSLELSKFESINSSGMIVLGVALLNETASSLPSNCNRVFGDT